MSQLGRLRVSAPGKAILCGEHAAVYGHPALVGSVGLRLSVEAEPLAEGLRIEIPQLDHDVERSWAEVDSQTELARRRWQEFNAEPAETAFQPVSEAPDALVCLAVGEARGRLEAVRRVGGARLRITSQIPVGAGLGSSAAVAVAVVAAMAELAAVGSGALASGDEIENVALEVEKRQHGRPSGIDTAIVRRGGLLWIESTASGLESTLVEASAEQLGAFQLFDTGKPDESTGEMVDGVRALRQRQRAPFDSAMQSIATATEQMRMALLGGRSHTQMLEAVRLAHLGLTAIGVVPASVARTIESIEQRGGAAKISGAGGRSCAGGLLLVYDPELGPGRFHDLLLDYRAIDAPLGAGGLKRET